MPRGAASFISEVNGLREMKRSVIPLLHAHIPSLSEQDEADINDAAYDGDAADLALRTCACGKRIDGFYDYVDHLTEVFVAAGFPKEVKR